MGGGSYLKRPLDDFDSNQNKFLSVKFVKYSIIRTFWVKIIDAFEWFVYPFICQSVFTSDLLLL